MKSSIISAVQKYVAAYPAGENTFTRWEPPIVGFADARDPLFDQLKSVASPTHATPRDFLVPAQTVIAFFLPFEKTMARTNIRGRHSSPEWGTAYIETNEMIRRLSLYLKTVLDGMGHDSVVIPATHNWDEKKLVSDWSHRHVAYVAGLGRFGLNNMLITAQGSCGRFGSLITSARITPDLRSGVEACLYKYDGTCKKCVDRCVTGALRTERFDRFMCYGMLLENVTVLDTIGYADVCGKCLTGVPCAHMNPVAAKIGSPERP